MTATVLVPLDGSEKDGRALPIAVAFAELAHGALHLIRVLDASPLSRGDAERTLRAVAERIAPTVGGAAGWEVADGPDVAAVLLRRAAELDADAVVMATRAPGPVGRAVHGSVADRVLREGTRAVLLVPPGSQDVHGRRVQLRRALVPLDGSAAALAVVELLLALPRVGELELVLLEVVPPARARERGSAPHAAAEREERRLEAVAGRLRARGARAEVRVVEGGDPAAVIGAAVRQELADFVAMTTRGAGGLARAVLGSTAASVLRASDVPVLLVTPGTHIP